MALRKPDSQAKAGSLADRAWVEEEFMLAYPTLYAYLTDVVWEGGGARQTATLLLTVDQGVLKGWLNDRACQRSAWVSGTSLAGLLASLEAGLSGDCLEWREAKDSGRKFSGRRT